mmetsp:Transcript_18930/g.44052  ORF Transcript_18930/g.44052 Transcript_18930/m.44052 type:complete len:96 (+) Transcript_18930:205-492(+)|eukprot:CAMPEP_0116843610 /NCGR_PEP_ID=MMETSP0418-20121206/12184_1 /TAXON_ID=1158023 /ORGANISM="Astrosyne radiata, Strain 13vi08-1A" /LENGTH=95 /DNA_ID=CAMNT_0004474383 /DNA_START=173 /DNA_END=460 /DNA_ORIENTATION=-
MSFIADVMQPGGGILILPFIKYVVGLLMCTTLITFLFGVARIHMAILTFLSGGLLFSLNLFETAYKRVKSEQGGGGKPAAVVEDKNSVPKVEKTD